MFLSCAVAMTNFRFRCALQGGCAHDGASALAALARMNILQLATTPGLQCVVSFRPQRVSDVLA